MTQPLATIDIKEENGGTEVLIHVSEAFEIREALREHGYHWNLVTRTWIMRQTFTKERDVDAFFDKQTTFLAGLGCQIE